MYVCVCVCVCVRACARATITTVFQVFKCHKAEAFENSLAMPRTIF